MRSHSDQLVEVLKGSHNRRLIVDVFHGSDRVMQNLNMVRWQLDGNLSSEVKHSGSGTIVYESVAGESLVPEGAEGILSPFRARLLLLMEITAGAFTETVTLGWAKVTSIPNAYDVFVDTDAGRVVSASMVEVTFESLEVNLKRRGFRFPEQPPSLLSAYAELRRISGMQVAESLPDKPLPTAFVYEASEGGRLKGVQAIAAVLGGVAVVNSVGALTVLPNEVGAPVGELALGSEGTVLDVAYSVETEGVYNCVVGSFEDANRTPIYAVAAVSDGPLAVASHYGEYTAYFSSPLVKTQEAATSAVEAMLRYYVGGQTYEVPVQCVTNPLIELGDVLAVVGHVRPLSGRVVRYSMSDSVLMNCTIQAERSL